MPAIKSILVPTAFSDLSRRAAEYVRLLAPAFGARVHVVHVVPHMQQIVDPSIPSTPFIPTPPADELLAQARASLQSFAADVFPDLKDSAVTAALHGGIVDELVAYAAKNSIDLIIMGTHADGMLKRLVFGSIGKSVLERAPCPVFLVPVHGASRD